MKAFKVMAGILLAAAVLLIGITPAYAATPMPWKILLAPPTTYDADAQEENRIILVTWKGTLPEGAYHQVEKTYPDGSKNYFSPITNGTFKDLDVKFESTYQYRIRAVKGNEKSEWTPPITRTVPRMPKPKDLAAEGKKDGTDVFVGLTWTKTVNFGWKIEVQRENPDGSQTTFTHQGADVTWDKHVDHSTTYKYRIRGKYEDQYSSWTSWVTVKTPIVLMVAEPMFPLNPTQAPATPAPTPAPTPTPTPTPTPVPEATATPAPTATAETAAAAQALPEATAPPAAPPEAKPAAVRPDGIPAWALVLIGALGTALVIVCAALLLNVLQKKRS